MLAVQDPAALADVKTPPPSVPACSVAGVAGLMASDNTFGVVNPVLAAVQAAPELIDLKTPPSVPAYTFADAAGSIAKALTRRVVNPALVQLPAESIDLNTPPSVPAKSVDSTGRLRHRWRRRSWTGSRD